MIAQNQDIRKFIFMEVGKMEKRFDIMLAVHDNKNDSTEMWGLNELQATAVALALGFEVSYVPRNTGEDDLNYWECFENTEEQDSVITALKEAIGKLDGGNATVESIVECIEKLLSIPLEL